MKEEPTVQLTLWDGEWPDDDPDANFKAEVALYVLENPMPTLERMAENLGIAPGALARYVLVKWANAGSETMLAAGPSMVERMQAICDEAEIADTNDARLAAYETLRQVIGWLPLGM